MAFRTQKISQMTPKGADLEATDLIEVSTIESGSYVTRSITGQELIDAIPLPPTGLTVGTTPISSGTIGRVLFQGTGNVLQQSSSLFWDNTNVRLGVGTSTPDYRLEVSSATGSQTAGILIKNLGNTSSDYASLNLLNNANVLAQVFNTSSGYTSAPVIGSNGFGHFTNGSGGLTLWADGGIIKFVTGSGAGALGSQKMTLFSTGNLAINTTTDAGFRLDVNGTARVQGNAQFGTGFYWDNTNGRLGIGTSSPSTTLHVVGQATISTSLSISGGFVMTEGGNVHTFTAPVTNRTIRFITNSQSFSLFPTGNFAIGTTTDAGYRLDVNGTARVSGAVTLSAASPSITLGGDLTITSTLYPSRVASYDILNSNLNLVAGGFGEGMFIGNRLTGSRTSTTFVSPDGLNAVGSAYISPYISNGNVIIRASNNGNRSIQMTGLGGGGSVLIGNITTGNGTQYTSILTLESTTQGFLPPRMTTTQKNAIATPATGLQVYDTTLNRPCFYDGTTWITL